MSHHNPMITDETAIGIIASNSVNSLPLCFSEQRIADVMVLVINETNAVTKAIAVL
jgi:hypothetical protein